jgi:putative peptide zinc metalloprotease protein
VQIRFPEQVKRKLDSGLVREVPAATTQLPSLVLSQAGGGDIAVDPRQGGQNQSFQRLFLFDVDLPMIERFYRVGERVHVRFDHGSEPLAYRWYRSIRNLFLKQFNV